MNSELSNQDASNVDINPEDEDVTELEWNEGKTDPEDDHSLEPSPENILAIIIILLLTSYVVYLKWQVRIDKSNEHQSNL